MSERNEVASTDLLDSGLLNQEFDQMKGQCDTSTWSATDERNFYAMFVHGWYGRAHEAAYQQKSNNKI